LTLGILPLSLLAQPSTPPPSGGPGAPPPRFTMPGAMQPKMAFTPMPDKDKLSYAIGMNIGNGIKTAGISINVDTVATAIRDVLSSNTTRLTEEQYKETLSQLNRAMASKRQADAEKGQQFLAENQKAEGVKTLPSGVEYKILQEGTGAMPKENDTVTVSYRGTLMDGSEFDHNDTFSTPVNGRIIRGWKDVLPLMKQGSKWKIFIPASMGYGPRGMPPKIGPNAVLIFDLALNSITPGAPTLPQLAPGTPGAPKAQFTSQAPGAPPNPPGGNNTPVVSGEIIKVPSADELKHGAKIEVIKPGQTNGTPAQ
jgi:FKBP-type peptidyl-prolyl cis-trans isomerase FklB